MTGDLPARRRAPAHRRALAGEDGQVLVLSLVLALVALMLVLVVSAVSTVYLDRKRLWALADEAALVAAGSVDEGAYYGGDSTSDDSAGAVPITRRSVETAVRSHLARADPRSVPPDAVLVRADTPDGRTAVVELRARSRPVLVGLLLDAVGTGGIEISVRASARAGWRAARRCGWTRRFS